MARLRNQVWPAVTYRKRIRRGRPGHSIRLTRDGLIPTKIEAVWDRNGQLVPPEDYSIRRSFNGRTTSGGVLYFRNEIMSASMTILFEAVPAYVRIAERLGMDLVAKRLYRQGLHTAEIARRLNVSHGTAQTMIDA
mgnify:CR=1 FL=1